MRVLVVADDGLTRAGLAGLLAGQPGCQVVGQVTASDGLAGAVDVYRPDALLDDGGWQPAAVLERVAELVAGDGPGRAEPPVVVLVPAADGAALAWAAGAQAVLLRTATPDQIVAALAAAMQRLAVLDPASAAALIASLPTTPHSQIEALTPRELQVLQLMAEGLANKAIAQALAISEHTVKFHVNSILGKLGAQSRTDAVVRATRAGLLLL